MSHPLHDSSPALPRNSLERDWLRFGANSDPAGRLDLEQASKYCKELATSHYENFSIASFLIPGDLRRHFYHVYAYCRWSDDLADESQSTQQATERLAWWQRELDNCFAGTTRHPVMVALRSTIDTFGLDQQPFDDLLSAFRQDQLVHRYQDDASLLDYCRRSANPVGRILLRMADVADPQCLEWSDQICTGLQLANFCQDMARDALVDRIYLPTSHWSSNSLTESMILQGRCTPELQRATLRWIVEIRERFYDGWQLTDHVPPWLARDVRLFAGGGLAILDAIARHRGDVWSQRIELGSIKKLRILLRGLMSRRPPARRKYGFEIESTHAAR